MDFANAQKLQAQYARLEDKFRQAQEALDECHHRISVVETLARQLAMHILEGKNEDKDKLLLEARHILEGR